MTLTTANAIHYLDARGPDGMLVYAIGDIHGRLDLLEPLHARIRDDITRRKPKDWRVIHLGDYVDRGADSKGVIDFLIAAQARDRRNICLVGNHEAGFVTFLDKPERDSLFARYGGVETAQSYGVNLNVFSISGFEKGSAELVAAVPAAHRTFLEGLKPSASFGDFFFCHAGIRPRVRIADQRFEDLIWIRDTFLRNGDLHEKVIVHGHTPASEPEVMANRVNIDTGAYMTGRLTALMIDGSNKEFIEAHL